MSPETLREELRHGSGPFLKRRRAIAGLSIFSCTILGGVALFQIGVRKHLPGPPIPGFAPDEIHGSPEAYAYLGVPDAFLGMTSYALTACLSGMGPNDRARWIPLAMTSKTLLDSVVAGKLVAKEIFKFRKFSLRSLLIAAATFTALSLALPEGIRAWRR
ncbi:MAG TPA: vitamin K epoxide reductase family protein [Bryobacteraceae bacterium]